MLVSPLRSLILNYLTSSSNTPVVIYKIYPESTPFTRKGELNINGKIDRNSNSGGLFVFLNMVDEVVLWNLATNDSITWKPPVERIQAVR